MCHVLIGMTLIIGWGVISIGTITLIGYLLGYPYFYTWSAQIGMAIPTATNFVLTGIAINLIGIALGRLRNKIYEIQTFK